MPLTTNQTRQIGSTSLRLPPLGFGAAHVGGRGAQIDGVQARRTLAAAWDCGIRYFDTAPFYGRGLSEHRVGDYLMDQPRSDFVLTTKVGRVFHRPADPAALDRSPWNHGLRMAFDFDYSHSGVMRSYEQSLMRLGIDTVDALMIHDPDQVAHGEHWQARMRDMATGGIKALEDLKRSGEIRAIGMGLNRTESVEVIPEMVDLDFLIVAMPYTLLDQSALPSLDRLAARGVAVVIGAPFASGILATGPVPGALYRYQPADEATHAKARAIEAVCQSHDVGLAAAALRFPLGHRAVVSVIPGGAHAEEVRKNAASFAERIPAALWSDLKAERLIDADAPVPQ
jgi:D-threo-aldose 1-dehydrogenase